MIPKNKPVAPPLTADSCPAHWPTGVGTALPQRLILSLCSPRGGSLLLTVSPFPSFYHEPSTPARGGVTGPTCALNTCSTTSRQSSCRQRLQRVPLTGCLHSLSVPRLINRRAGCLVTPRRTLETLVLLVDRTLSENEHGYVPGVSVQGLMGKGKGNPLPPPPPPRAGRDGLHGQLSHRISLHVSGDAGHDTDGWGHRDVQQ